MTQSKIGLAQMARIAPTIDRAEYTSFAALLRDDPAVSGSYLAWLTERTEDRGKELSRGEILFEEAVSFEEFKANCLNANPTPTSLLSPS